MKRAISVTLAVLMLFAIVATVLTPAVHAADGTETTKVTFRIVPAAGWQIYSGATLQVVAYTDAAGNEPYEEISVNVLRNRGWQATVSLIKGMYYRVILASIDNDLLSQFFGETEMFYVGDEKMTVYCGIPDKNGKAPEMPDEWCVEGEDTQNFKIWAPETSGDDSLHDSESSSEQGGETDESGSVSPIPGHSTDVIPDTDRSQTGNNPSPSHSDTSDGEGEVTFAKIGDYITTAIIVIIVVASAITLFVISERKKQIK